MRLGAVDVDCVLTVRGGGGPIGECPVWCVEEQCLYWIDIRGGELHRFDPSNGRNSTLPVGEPVGSFALRREGGFVLATRSGLRFWNAAGADERKLPPVEPDKPGNRPNDGRCDRSGRFWFGTMRDPPSGAAEPQGSLYRLDPTEALQRLAGGLFAANGLAFSPDGRVLYHSDSFTSVRTVWTWDVEPESGTLSNRRVFVTTHGLEGRPDGACVDAEGCYWSCHIDGWQVVRYMPNGRIDRVIRLPVRWPTMCAFGGRELDILFITSLRRGGPDAEWPDQPLAGSLFACRPGVRGLPEPRFADL